MDTATLVIASMFVWIGENTPYNIHIPWPTIQYLDEAAMEKRAGPPRPGSNKEDTERTVGRYGRNEGRIYLLRGTNILTLEGKSRLLHEMIHHVQNFNKDKAPLLLDCREKEAYATENKWRREHHLRSSYIPDLATEKCQ